MTPFANVRVVTLLFILPVFASIAAEPPRSWPPNPFTPLSLERISALPPDEQKAWKTYWKESEKLAGKRQTNPVTEFSPLKPITGPSIPALHSKGLRFDAPAEWYSSDEARTIADRVVACQTDAGAWTKGNDYTQSKSAAVAIEGNIWDRGTFDNNATIFEMRFLALVNTASLDNSRSATWRKSFLRGLHYIFAAQYPNGGFPQVYPLAGGYHDNITFNDDAMIHALELLCDVAAGKSEYKFVPARLRKEAQQRMERGVRCILATQLKTANGQRIVWCQQYDALTLQPAAARNFEPIAACAQESTSIVKFLMSLPDPSPEVTSAINDAMAWFRRTPLQNIRWSRFTNDAQITVSAGAPLMWARFYELNTDKPIFGDRDRTIHYNMMEISDERRRGYTWYGTWPATVLGVQGTPSSIATVPAAVKSATNRKFTYVIVHGAWGGSWDWKHVDELLTADGHTVYRPALTGQGERSHLASTNIDLSLHIQDIVNVILWEDLHSVVLVGHSYGGMVITGVADRVADRIKHVIYLDAMVPEDGECAMAIRGGIGFDQAIKDGFVLPVWLKGDEPVPHDVPHPLQTLNEPISLTNQDVARKLPTTYILTVDKDKSPEQDDFFKFYERARARNWPTLVVEADHNPQRLHPRELLEWLEQAP